MNRVFPILAALAVLASCTCGRSAAPKSQPKEVAFPAVEVPSMIGSYQERAEYAALHYWDRFASADTLVQARVPDQEIEKQTGAFATLLTELPPAVGVKAMEGLADAAESSPTAYSRLVETASRYFYDPNSPVRDESLYLPFVSRLASSPLTPNDRRPSYEWAARMCALNAPGTIAADFEFIDTMGRRRTLHGTKAKLLVLVFGNPDCHACKELVEQMEGMDLDGVKVMDIYIDQDIDLWKERISTYPKDWINGYDPAFIIRNDLIYNVRALPSIYLLDSSKRVILKDATMDHLLYVLNQQPQA